MKTYCFGLSYLGGPVDLPRFRQSLAGEYPGSSLVMKRGEKVLITPLAKGELTSPEGTLPYEITAYHIESGFGIWIIAVESKAPVATILDNPLSLLSQPAIGQVMIDFMKRSFKIENIANLDSILHHKDGAKNLRAATGIEISWIGQEDSNIGFDLGKTTLVVGPSLEAMDMGAAAEISLREGEAFALSPDRLWARAMSEDLLWDLILTFLKEHGARRLKSIALQWLEHLKRQLIQMQAGLEEKNEAVWAQDREDVERLDLRFHLFSSEVRKMLVRSEFLWLEAIDRKKWEPLSLYPRQKGLVDEALAEGSRLVERMTRPLDFREFKLLKSGVEEVEARIMLLTVLLVLMEFFAQALVPGHWAAKGILLLLIVAIPAGYLFFERWRKQEMLRKGRVVLFRNRLERVSAEIKDLEQEMERLKSVDVFSGGAREVYEREVKEMVSRLKEKKREYELELDGKP